MSKRNRNFLWISSIDPKNKEILNQLDRDMSLFYSEVETRNPYQNMVDEVSNDIDNPSLVTSEFSKFLNKNNLKHCLEVGCGSGRIYKYLKREIEHLQYTGIELSQGIISDNKKKYPEATWLKAGVYEIPAESNSIDVCFSFYVLEHLCFPKKAIEEMMRIVKKNGYLILIFPDFVETGRFASQYIGFSNYQTATEKIKKLKFFDALISLYDSRIRLPKALKKVAQNTGKFPVNINPKCLNKNMTAYSPDIDAVYIASKKEIKDWAVKRGYKVNFPAGTSNYFNEHVFISIQKC